MPVHSTFYPRVFALAVAALLAYALLRIFLPFAGPIAWAAFSAFLLFEAICVQNQGSLTAHHHAVNKISGLGMARDPRPDGQHGLTFSQLLGAGECGKGNASIAGFVERLSDDLRIIPPR